MQGNAEALESPSLEEAFRGPTAFERIRPILRRAPALAPHVLAVLTVVDGLVRRRRFLRACQWASRAGYPTWRIPGIAVGLLATHGRFLALESMLGIPTMDDLAAQTTIVGRERLEHLEGGALLLGMHLGPPRSWLALRACGLPVAAATRRTPIAGTVLEAWVQRGFVVSLPMGEAADRVRGLYRLHRLLEHGGLVYLPADGPLGGELFRLDVAGAPIIRTGWYGLRRHLRVPVFPVLAHRAGGRTVITVHPPLPAPVDDGAEDSAACRSALTAIVRRYATEHPTQCRYLAFPDWHDGSGAASPAGELT